MFCLLTASTVLFILLQVNIYFHTIWLILCFQQNRWDGQPHWTLGQSILVVLCAGSTLLLTPVVRPAKSQLATPSEVISFSYWSIKPWFLTEGKLAAVLIIPSSWGFPTVCPAHAARGCWNSIWFWVVGGGGRREFRRGGPKKPMYEPKFYRQDENVGPSRIKFERSGKKTLKKSS